MAAAMRATPASAPITRLATALVFGDGLCVNVTVGVTVGEVGRDATIEWLSYRIIDELGRANDQRP